MSDHLLSQNVVYREEQGQYKQGLCAIPPFASSACHVSVSSDEEGPPATTLANVSNNHVADFDRAHLMSGVNKLKETAHEDFKDTDIDEGTIKANIKYVKSEEWVDVKSWEEAWPQQWWESPQKDKILIPISLVISLQRVPCPEADGIEIDDAPSAILGSEDFSGRRPNRLSVPCKILNAEIIRVSGFGNIDQNLGCTFVRPFKNIVPFYREFQESWEAQKRIYKDLLEVNRQCQKDDDESLPQEVTDSKDTGTAAGIDQRLGDARKLFLGLSCLLRFITHDIADIMELRRCIEVQDIGGWNRRIAFEDLWHIFEPGRFVCSKDTNVQLYYVLKTGGGRLPRTKAVPNSRTRYDAKHGPTTDFFIDCFNFDFDGSGYGPCSQHFTIAPYDGFRAIENLIVAPLAGLYSREEETQLLNRLLARGKKFERLAKLSHQRYSGLSLPHDSIRREEIEGYVVVDFPEAFANMKPQLRSGFGPPKFNGGIIETQTICEDREVVAEALGDNVSYTRTSSSFNDARCDATRRVRAKKKASKWCKESQGDLCDEAHILLPYKMLGYVLQCRKWFPLDIDLLEDIKQAEHGSDGFDNLVIPQSHKDIILSLIQTHARNEALRTAFNMDLVKGKGMGLIILLHGAPGVGKTSTAECVAAHTNRALFPITCGDIGGQNPTQVESDLLSYFDLARKWGCILLLDEADVFLGERLKGDVRQNSLVSVFLRVLEYYDGILILTTNRVGQFDEAIRSRIHISLYYEPLNEKTTKKIWKSTLRRLQERQVANEDKKSSMMQRGKPALPQLIFDRDEILGFALSHYHKCKATGSHWNGRQIKNAFQTAIGLAEWEVIKHSKGDELTNSRPIELRAEHFRKVAEVSDLFETYLRNLRSPDSVNAMVNMNRLDTFNADMYRYGPGSTSYRHDWPMAEHPKNRYGDREDRTAQRRTFKDLDDARPSQPERRRRNYRASKISDADSDSDSDDNYTSEARHRHGAAKKRAKEPKSEANAGLLKASQEVTRSRKLKGSRRPSSSKSSSTSEADARQLKAPKEEARRRRSKGSHRPPSSKSSSSSHRHAKRSSSGDEDDESTHAGRPRGGRSRV